LPLSAIEVLTRLSVWLGGALMTMPVLVGWQLMARRPQQEEGEAMVVETRRLAVVALVGTVLALAARLSVSWQGDELAHLLGTPLARPYLIAALIGAGLQAGAWLLQFRMGRLGRARLAIASAGTAMALLGVSVIHETIRLASVDLEALYPLHAEAARIGGLAVFLAFAVINIGLIGLCVWLVRRGLRRPQDAAKAAADDENQATSKPRSVTV
jgi:hypothetical protein